MSLNVFPQSKFQPSIVVLNPLNFKYDSSLSKEVQEYIEVRVHSEAERKEFMKTLEGEKENNRIMDLAEYEYRLNKSIPAFLTLGLFSMITYRIFGENDKGLIIPSHDKSNNLLEELKKVAMKYNVDWVVCPVELNCYMKERKKFSMARIVLYNLPKNKIIIQKDFVGGSDNPGFELSCNEGSLECTLSNLIGDITHDVVLATIGSYQH